MKHHRGRDITCAWQQSLISSLIRVVSARIWVAKLNSMHDFIYTLQLRFLDASESGVIFLNLYMLNLSIIGIAL